MQEVANTGLLVSLYNNGTSANLEVFDVSRKGQVRKTYSFVEVSGGRFFVKVHLIIIFRYRLWRCDL